MVADSSNSPTLSGTTQGNNTRVEGRHYEMYRSADIHQTWSAHEMAQTSSLGTEEDCRNAMVLVALLSGGDYDPGVDRLGPTVSMGLAHAGCSNFLKLYSSDRSAFEKKLGTIHQYMVHEMKSNETGFIGMKQVAKAKTLEAMDPSEVFKALPLDAYLNPVRSPEDPTQGWPGFGEGERSPTRGMSPYGGRWTIESAARACERYFEWGTKEMVCKRFSGDNGLYCAEVISEARRAVLSGDQGAPNLSFKVHSTRPSPLSDDMTDIRLSFKTETYMERSKNAMVGHRCDPSELSPEEREALDLVAVSASQAATDTAPPKEEIRTWFPEYLIRAAWPSIVEEYEKAVAEKAAAKATPKKKRGPIPKKAAVTTENAEAFRGFFLVDTCSQAPVGARRHRKTTASIEPPSSPLSSAPPSPTPSPTPTRLRSHVSGTPTPVASTANATPAPITVPSSPDIIILDAAPETLSVSRKRATRKKATESLSAEAEKRSHSSLSQSTRASSRAPSVTRQTRSSPKAARTVTSPKRTSRAPSAPNERVTTTASGSAAAPIDLCDSDGIPTPPRRRGRPRKSPATPTPLQASITSNMLPSPTPTSHTLPPSRIPIASATPKTKAPPSPKKSSASPRKKSQSTSPVQATLDQLIIARARRKPASKPKPESPKYILETDEGGVEHIYLRGTKTVH